MQSSALRIGTRGSKLALAQTHAIRDRLIAVNDLDPASVQVEIITTSGDRIKEGPLREVGGKGLFTKEIEESLLARRIDLAVHSLKDLESALPEGLTIACVPEREDPRDAFVSLHAASLDALPNGARLGTSSLRRGAQVKRARPDLVVVEFRGNVDTRLAKLESGVADATVLAHAGLKRLGLGARVAAVLETDVMLPAVGQGALAIETRSHDERLRALLAPLQHEPTAACVAAERAFLAKLDGSCRTPIAGLAEIDAGRLRFRGQVLSPDGTQCFAARREGSPADATALGEDAADEILARAGTAFFAALERC